MWRPDRALNSLPSGAVESRFSVTRSPSTTASREGSSSHVARSSAMFERYSVTSFEDTSRFTGSAISTGSYEESSHVGRSSVSTWNV